MAAQQRRPGRSVYGEAGGGLRDAKWAANDAVAQVGRSGELKTADVLNRFAHDARSANGGPTVLHDLAIPIPGFTANIDHVVVSGRNVLLVDTKAWAAGFYWTLGGRTRRGMSAFPHADKQTMGMAQDALARFFAQHGVQTARLRTPVVVIWPTGHSRPTRIAFLKIPRAKAMLGPVFARRVRRLAGDDPADPAVLGVLLRLVNGKGTQPLAQPTPTMPLAAVPAVDTSWLDPSDPVTAPFVQPVSPHGQRVDWDDTGILTSDDF